MNITLHLNSDFIRHLGTLGEDLIEFDLDDLLDDNRLIAHVWCIEDVQELRPDLSEDQCWEVLQRVNRNKDAELGITWFNLEFHARKLFGPAPVNHTSEQGA